MEEFINNTIDYLNQIKELYSDKDESIVHEEQMAVKHTLKEMRRKLNENISRPERREYKKQIRIALEGLSQEDKLTILREELKAAKSVPDKYGGILGVSGYGGVRPC